MSDLIKKEFLQNFSMIEIDKLIILMKPHTFSAGEIFLNEGDTASEIYFIIEGEVEIIKKSHEKAEFHRIDTLTEGDTIGEIAFFDQEKRSASVRALTQVKIGAITYTDIKNLEATDPRLYAKIETNIAKEICKRLRTTTNTTVVSLQKDLENSRLRVSISSFIINIFFIVTLYAYALRSLVFFESVFSTDAPVSIAIGIAFASVTLMMIFRSGLPLSIYGITWKNWKVSMIEGIVFTLPLLPLVVLLKWSALNLMHGYSQEPLFHNVFQYDLEVTHVGIFSRLLLIGLYALFAPVQEIITRGALQGSLQMFLTGRYHIFWAIIVSNLIFSLTHLYLSIFLSFSVLFTGCFWGWMFYRQKSLIGVGISHIILGIWTLHIVGIRVFMS